MTRTTRTPAPKIDTAAYERAHGRKPRGYGAWWFAAIDANTGSVLDSQPCTGQYSQAKAIARARLDVTADGREYYIELLS